MSSAVIVVLSCAAAAAAAAVVWSELRARRNLRGQAESERRSADLLQSRFHAAVDRAPVGVVMIGLDGSVELVNDRLLELLKLEPGAERTIFSSFLPEDIPSLRSNLERLTSGEVDHIVQDRQLVRSDGSQVWCRISSSTVIGLDGEATALIGHVQDIEAERAAVEALRSRTRWFSSIVEQSSDMILLFDADGLVTWASPSTATILGYDPEHVLGRRVIDLVHRDDRARVASAIGSIQAGQMVRAEYRVLHASGQWIWLESTASDLLGDPDIAAMITTSRDVTARHQAAEVLAHRAAHDPLTGLANRAELESQLGAGLDRVTSAGEAIAVAFLDLDGFKAVNDLHGHTVGDELLREVARCLGKEVRTHDLIARLGGDEFVIVHWGADLAAALTISERIRRRLAQPIEVPGTLEPVEVSASIGLAVASPGDSVTSLLHEADLAVYEAKRRGRDRVEVSARGLAELGDEVDELIRTSLRNTE